MEIYIKREPIIEKAVDILKAASLDLETSMQYEAREKALKDIALVRGDGLREGKKEVVKKGFLREWTLI